MEFATFTMAFRASARMSRIFLDLRGIQCHGERADVAFLFRGFGNGTVGEFGNAFLVFADGCAQPMFLCLDVGVGRDDASVFSRSCEAELQQCIDCVFHLISGKLGNA